MCENLPNFRKNNQFMNEFYERESALMALIRFTDFMYTRLMINVVTIVMINDVTILIIIIKIIFYGKSDILTSSS